MTEWDRLAGLDQGRRETESAWHAGLAALILDDGVRILGARVRLEWVDPEPPVARVFAERLRSAAGAA